MRDGATSHPPSAGPPGGDAPEPVLGPFAPVRVLGRGGMSVVWEGRHEDGTAVAIKVVTEERARDLRFVQALRDEVRAVAVLGHPRIVTVLDTGTVGEEAEAATQGALVAGCPYLVMELARGGPLDRRDPPTSFGELRDQVLALLDGLAHAHARGVVHRDLKPGNVLVAGRDDLRPGLKLSDFGLAVAIGRSPELAATAGTPAFMAPEQFRGDWRSIGPSTDLYALGCMAWYWATHRPLYQGDRRQLARAHQLQALPEFQPRYSVPQGLEEWLGSLLVKEPGYRCQRAADAAWALMQLGLPSDLTDVPLSALATLQTMTEIPDSEAEVLEPVFEAASSDGWKVLPAAPMPDAWETGTLPVFPIALHGAGLALFGSRAVPIIGRREERDDLWACLKRVVRMTRPGAVLLQGAGGVGKTRLAQWLCERAEELGAAQVLRATHEPQGAVTDGLRGMLARHLRTDGLSGRDLQDWLERRLASPRTAEGGAATRTDISIPAITAFLGDGDDAPQWRAEERWLLIRRVLEVEARARPLILWIEDAQWGADALRFCSLLLSGHDPLPVLVVLTVRGESLPERPAERAALDRLTASRRLHQVPLAPPPREDCAALLVAMLPLDPALADRVAQAAGGNPLFALQLVGDWVARGLLAPQPLGFGLEGPWPDVPGDLSALWIERIARAVGARPDALAAVEVAAALGVEVLPAEWADAAGRLSLPTGGLAERLLEAGLAVGSVDGWHFAHGLLRESVLARARVTGRLPGVRAACANMLLGLPDNPVRRAARARHLLGASEPDEALPLLLSSAWDLLVQGDLARAEVLVEEWQRAIDQLELPESDPRRAAGLVFRIEIAIRSEELGAARTCAADAVARARRFGWKNELAACLRAGATAAYLSGFLDEADASYAESRDLAAEAGAFELEMGALCGLGHVARLRGALIRAAHWYEQALQMRAQCDSTRWAQEALIGLGMALFHAGAHEEAKEVLEEVRALVVTTGSPMAQGIVHTCLGEVARDRGDLGAALEHYRSAAEVDRAIGRDALVPKLNYAVVLVLSERYPEARIMLDALLSATRREKSVAETFVRAALLVCDGANHRWEAWDRHFGEIERSMAASGVVEPDLGLLLHRAGRLAVHAGQSERAQGALAASLRQYRALDRADRVEEIRREMLVGGEG